jgi:predicted O-methyltransferase YrrM
MLLVRNKKIRQVLGVLETVNIVGLKLLFKNRTQFGLYPGRVFRDYMGLAKFDQWTSRSIFELFPEIPGGRVTLEYLSGGGINTAMDELAYLAVVTRALAPRHVFEIGTFRGRTALNFALNSPDDCRVYTLDLPSERRSDYAGQTCAADATIIGNSTTGVDYRGKDVAHKIEQLYGNSQEFDFRPYYGRIDLVFIDGAHHYDAVRSDTEHALKMVRSGGVVLWHDFANYGDYNDVTRAALELVPQGELIQIANTELAMYRKP